MENVKKHDYTLRKKPIKIFFHSVNQLKHGKHVFILPIIERPESNHV